MSASACFRKFRSHNKLVGTVCTLSDAEHCNFVVCHLKVFLLPHPVLSYRLRLAAEHHLTLLALAGIQYTAVQYSYLVLSVAILSMFTQKGPAVLFFGPCRGREHAQGRNRSA